MGIWSSHIADEEDGFVNNSIPSIQEDVLTLRNENELLKSKLSKIENICSQYVSNELACKIKEIILEEHAIMITDELRSKLLSERKLAE